MRVFDAVQPRVFDRRYLRELGRTTPAPFGRDAFDVHELWAEDLIDQRWRAAYRLSFQRGAIVVSEVRLSPAEDHEYRPRGGWSADALGPTAKVPRGGVKATLLRQVRPLKSLKRAASLARQLDKWERELFGGVGERISPLTSLPAEPSPIGRRRPQVPDGLLRRVAVAYRNAFRRDPRRVNVLAAGALVLDVVRVRDLVWLARKRGFLPKTTPGTPSIR